MIDYILTAQSLYIIIKYHKNILDPRSLSLSNDIMIYMTQ